MYNICNCHIQASGSLPIMAVQPAMYLSEYHTRGCSSSLPTRKQKSGSSPTTVVGISGPSRVMKYNKPGQCEV